MVKKTTRSGRKIGFDLISQIEVFSATYGIVEV